MSRRLNVGRMGEVLEEVAALAEDEFATDETAEIPEWGGDFERGAMWAFAEAARLTRAALDRGEVSS